MLLVLTRGGCREADVGSDTLEVGLLEAKVETKRRFGNVLVGRPGRIVIFGVFCNLADVQGRHAFACW